MMKHLVVGGKNRGPLSEVGHAHLDHAEDYQNLDEL
jgi:hypothetical protein